jgi:hypothetical protein
MPPISIGPWGPHPVIMGTVFSGISIDISPISAMPAVPMGMYSGRICLIFYATSFLSTPMNVGIS